MSSSILSLIVILQVINTIGFAVLIYAALRLPGQVLRQMDTGGPNTNPSATGTEKSCAVCGMEESLARLTPVMGDRHLCWACRQEVVDQEGFAGERIDGARGPLAD